MRDDRGEEPIEKGVNLAIAHIDSPRLDLKPNPMYESEKLAYFDTHYYGGVKKYQWVTIPLALHGTVVRGDGTSVDISIGEDEGDPIFYITDLLPHLSRDQMTKPLGTAISGEALNVLIGSMPVGDEKVSSAVKLNALRLLNEKYGITEFDRRAFLCPCRQSKGCGT